jgi:hypothetical protein
MSLKQRLKATLRHGALTVTGAILLAFGFNTIDVCMTNTVWSWEQIPIAPYTFMLEWHWYLIGLICFGTGAFLLGWQVRDSL